MGVHPETLAAATAIAAAINDKNGLDLAVLDVSPLLVITDLFVIAHGTSRRHVMTLAEEVQEQLKAIDRRPLRREGFEDGQWILLDYGDVVVHCFDTETRDYYDLERLWLDAARLELVPSPH